MNTLDLVVSGSDKIVAYACGKCKYVKKDKASADKCCLPKEAVIVPRCACGNQLYHSNVKCYTCKEFDRLSAAVEVEYDGNMVYYPNVPEGDGYFMFPEDLIDWWNDHQEDNGLDNPLPEFAFCTNPMPFRVDADSMLERALEEHHEDAYASLVDKDVLFKFVHEWAEMQPVISYEVDYKRKVRLR